MVSDDVWKIGVKKIWKLNFKEERELIYDIGNCTGLLFYPTWYIDMVSYFSKYVSLIHLGIGMWFVELNPQICMNVTE